MVLMMGGEVVQDLYYVVCIVWVCVVWVVLVQCDILCVQFVLVVEVVFKQVLFYFVVVGEVGFKCGIQVQEIVWCVVVFVVVLGFEECGEQVVGVGWYVLYQQVLGWIGVGVELGFVQVLDGVQYGSVVYGSFFVGLVSS